MHRYRHDAQREDCTEALGGEVVLADPVRGRVQQERHPALPVGQRERVVNQVEQGKGGELEYDLSPLRVGERAADACHFPEPGGESEKTGPILVDIDGAVQRAVRVNVLDHPDGLVEPGVASLRVHQGAGPVEHDHKPDRVQGHPPLGGIRDGELDHGRQDEESDSGVEDDRQLRRKPERPERRCVRPAYPDHPQHDADRQGHVRKMDAGPARGDGRQYGRRRTRVGRRHPACLVGPDAGR